MHSRLLLSSLASSLVLVACGGASDDQLFPATAAAGQGGSIGASGATAGGSAGVAGNASGGAAQAGSGGAAGQGQGGASAGAGGDPSAGAGGETSAGSGGTTTAGAGGKASGGAGAGGKASGGAGGKASGGGGAGGKASGGAGGKASGGAGQAGAQQGGASGGPAAGAGGQGGDAGAGGAPPSCTPGAVSDCYEGPASTDGVGPCHGGQSTCESDGTPGPCVGQVLPVVDACDGVDTDCDGAWSAYVPQSCPTIQGAIDFIAQQGLTAKVIVAAGTYKEDLHFSGAAADVVGAGPASTTLQGSGAGPVVTFDSGEGPDSVLEGFTIKGGKGRADADGKTIEGGGIYVTKSDPILRQLDVTGNTAQGVYGYGGGIFLGKSEARVSFVRVWGNSSSHYGGGIAVSQGLPHIDHVTIVENKSVYGGGLSIYFADAVVTNSIFSKNDGYDGGAIMIQGMSPSFDFLTLVANVAKEGGGVYLTSNATPTLRDLTMSGGTGNGGALFVDTGSPTVAYGNAYANGPSPIVGIGPIAGLLSVDPTFVSTTGPALGWDLHLGPASALRGAGDPNLKDPDGSACDIGAHGGPDAAP